jgi:hypothetical protein
VTRCQSFPDLAALEKGKGRRSKIIIGGSLYLAVKETNKATKNTTKQPVNNRIFVSKE